MPDFSGLFDNPKGPDFSGLFDKTEKTGPDFDGLFDQTPPLKSALPALDAPKPDWRDSFMSAITPKQPGLVLTKPKPEPQMPQFVPQEPIPEQRGLLSQQTGNPLQDAIGSLDSGEPLLRSQQKASDVAAQIDPTGQEFDSGASGAIKGLSQAVPFVRQMTRSPLQEAPNPSYGQSGLGRALRFIGEDIAPAVAELSTPAGPFVGGALSTALGAAKRRGAQTGEEYLREMTKPEVLAESAVGGGVMKSIPAAESLPGTLGAMLGGQVTQQSASMIADNKDPFSAEGARELWDGAKSLGPLLGLTLAAKAAPGVRSMLFPKRELPPDTRVPNPNYPELDPRRITAAEDQVRQELDWESMPPEWVDQSASNVRAVVEPLAQPQAKYLVEKPHPALTPEATPVPEMPPPVTAEVTPELRQKLEVPETPPTKPVGPSPEFEAAFTAKDPKALMRLSINPEDRLEFERRTGVALPKNYKGTQAALEQWAKPAEPAQPATAKPAAKEPWEMTYDEYEKSPIRVGEWMKDHEGENWYVEKLPSSPEARDGSMMATDESGAPLSAYPFGYIDLVADAKASGPSDLVEGGHQIFDGGPNVYWRWSPVRNPFSHARAVRNAYESGKLVSAEVLSAFGSDVGKWTSPSKEVVQPSKPTTVAQNLPRNEVADALIDAGKIPSYRQFVESKGVKWADEPTQHDALISEYRKIKESAVSSAPTLTDVLTGKSKGRGLRTRKQAQGGFVPEPHPMAEEYGGNFGLKQSREPIEVQGWMYRQKGQRRSSMPSAKQLFREKLIQQPESPLGETEKAIWSDVLDVLPDHFFDDGLEVHIGGTASRAGVIGEFRPHEVTSNNLALSGNLRPYQVVPDVIALFNNRTPTAFLHELGHRGMWRSLSLQHLTTAVDIYKGSPSYKRFMSTSDPHIKYKTSFSEWFANRFHDYSLAVIGEKKPLFKSKLEIIFDAFKEKLAKLWERVSRHQSNVPLKEFFDEFFDPNYKKRPGYEPTGQWGVEQVTKGIDATYSPKTFPAIRAEPVNKRVKLLTPKQAQGGFVSLGTSQRPLDPVEQRIADRIAPVQDAKRTTQMTLGDRLKTEIFDEYHPIYAAEKVMEKVTGKKRLSSESGYQDARRLKSVTGTIEQALQHGIRDENGKPMSRGVVEILKPVAKDLDRWERYALSRHVLEKQSQGLETGINRGDAVAFTRRMDQENPHYAKVWDEYKQFGNSALKKLYDSGRISKEQYDNVVAKNKEYITMERELTDEELEGALNTLGTGKGLAGSPDVLKAMKGSERRTVSPIQTHMRNVARMIVVAEKNNAMRNILKPLSEVPEMADYVQKVKEPGNNTVSYYENGEAVHHKVDPEIYKSVKALDLEGQGILGKIMTPFANALRIGQTIDPAFSIANLVRDAFQSAVVSTRGGVPFGNLARGIVTLLKDREALREFKYYGGDQGVEGAHIYDRKAFMDKLPSQLDGRLKAARKHPVQTLLTPMKWSEEVTRLGEYQRQKTAALKEGATPIEAMKKGAYEARNLMDFALGGRKTKGLKGPAAFFGAGLSGMYREFEALKNNPVKTTLRGLTWFSVPSIALYMRNRDDEDYKGLPQFVKDANWVVRKGEGKNNFLYIPKPPGPLGYAFTTGFERALAATDAKDKKALDGLLSGILSQAVPNPVPTVARTPAELIANYSFYQERPIESDSLKKLPPDLRTNDKTSLASKGLASVLHKGGVNISPIKTDYALRGLFGAGGRHIVNSVVDPVIGKLTGQTPPNRNDTLFSMKRFYGSESDTGSENVSRFYNALSEQEQAVERMKATGEGAGNKALVRQMQGVSRQMSEIRAKMQKAPDDLKPVYADQLDALAKRFDWLWTN